MRPGGITANYILIIIIIFVIIIRAVGIRVRRGRFERVTDTNGKQSDRADSEIVLDKSILDFSSVLVNIYIYISIYVYIYIDIA